MRHVDVQHFVGGDFEEYDLAIGRKRMRGLESRDGRFDGVDVGGPRRAEQLAPRREAALAFGAFHYCPPLRGQFSVWQTSTIRGIRVAACAKRYSGGPPSRVQSRDVTTKWR